MGNMVDYVRTEFRTFDRKRFSAVDSLVLSELAYIRMPATVPAFGSARSVATVPIWRLLQAEHYGSMFCTGSEYDAGRHDLLVAMAESPRFRGLRVGEYAQRSDERTETQFAAVTFDLTDCAGMRGDGQPAPTLYVAFRGTDNSLVGWKEDFNMSVRCPVPSQTQAVEYYRSIDERASSPYAAHPARIALGGHSKGGNLAVYTAMQTQSPHIARIFSHDGPGFMREVTQSAAFKAIEPHVEKTVPEASVIGMLMSTVSRYDIVETNVSGIMQHMGLNWRIDNGEFVTKPELSPVSRLLDRTLDAWMEQFTNEERARAVDQCYDIIASAGYTSFAEIADHMGEALPAIAEAARKTDEATRSLIVNIIKALPATAAKSLFEEWSDETGSRTRTRRDEQRQ
ncbi:Mbeg1-like protein [Bifidobacterium erythrocebi]|nr:Mbeg1-like protein [Bifidobacterium sp. DSM 109960]